MIGDQAVIEVWIVLDEGVNVLSVPEDDLGPAEVRQGAAQNDAPVPLVFLRQSNVGCSVGRALGEDILDIGIPQDVVRLNCRCAENKHLMCV